MTAVGIFFLAIACGGLIFFYLLHTDKGLRDKRGKERRPSRKGVGCSRFPGAKPPCLNPLRVS
jgi:hypothetical protein